MTIMLLNEFQERGQYLFRNVLKYSHYFILISKLKGKQAVVVLLCENTHMPSDMIADPGIVMIFAHGVEDVWHDYTLLKESERDWKIYKYIIWLFNFYKTKNANQKCLHNTMFYRFFKSGIFLHQHKQL